MELKAAHPERMLELTLTDKEGGKVVGSVPMAGIPHHAAEHYCSELIRRVFSMALCNQLVATPAKAMPLKRDIIRVLTPGTALEKGILAARRNNWLAAVVIELAHRDETLRWGLASADVNTGEVQVMQRQDSDALHQQLAQLGAAELLSSTPERNPVWCPNQLRLTPVASTPFSRPAAEAALLHHYKLASLGLPELPLALGAMCGLLANLHDTQPLEENACVQLKVPAIVQRGDAYLLETQTRRNLELTATQKDGALLGVTALGN